MSKSHSRRAILAGIATAPALAAPALALTGPDPIFAAIEANRKADTDFIRLCDLEADLEESGVELLPAPDSHNTAAMEAVVDAGIKSRQSLARTAPTTLAGLVAYLDYVRHWSPDEFLFADDDEGMDFLDSLHRTVHALSAGFAS